MKAGGAGQARPDKSTLAECAVNDQSTLHLIDLVGRTVATRVAVTSYSFF